jgi:hypothetical protein
VWYRRLEFIFNHWIGFIEYCLYYDNLKKKFGTFERSGINLKKQQAGAGYLYRGPAYYFFA